MTLTSIEDDALVEEVQVVWEAEIGARVFKRVALPSPEAGFYAPSRFDPLRVLTVCPSATSIVLPN